MKRTTWRDRLKARGIRLLEPQLGWMRVNHEDGEYVSGRRASTVIAALEREIKTLSSERDEALHQMEEWKAAQTYRYIGVDGKPVLARELEERALKAESEIEILKGTPE